MKLDILARVTDAARPGPWRRFYDDYQKGTWCIGRTPETAGDIASDVPEAEAAFIAAADPNTVGALIDVVQAYADLFSYVDFSRLRVGGKEANGKLIDKLAWLMKALEENG